MTLVLLLWLMHSSKGNIFNKNISCKITLDFSKVQKVCKLCDYLAWKERTISNLILFCFYIYVQIVNSCKVFFIIIGSSIFLPILECSIKWHLERIILCFPNKYSEYCILINFFFNVRLIQLCPLIGCQVWTYGSPRYNLLG